MKKYFPKFFSTQTPRELAMEQEYYKHLRKAEEVWERERREYEESLRKQEENSRRLEREAFLKTTQSLYN